jgi:hypothetical protein
MSRKTLTERVLHCDRRLIYLLMLACVTLPFYLHWPRTGVEVSREVESAFAVIDSIPAGGNPLLISFDYDPGSAAELSPMGVAVLRHCFRKGIRVLAVSLQPTGQGAGVATDMLPRIAAEYGRKQNVDWAFLGFQPNPLFTMLQMGESIPKAFPRDYFGTPVDQIPLMIGIQNYRQIAAVLSLAGTAVIETWAVYAGTRYGVTVLGGVTGVAVADIQPFYQSGQIKGILGGMKGAAEYEKRINMPGDATEGMGSQRLAHYLIIAFVLLGNAAYLAGRRRKR